MIGDWANELFAQPIDDTWPHWKFQHPDGRRNIAYRVGTWIADRAIKFSGQSASQLVWAPPADVLALADL